MVRPSTEDGVLVGAPVTVCVGDAVIADAAVAVAAAVTGTASVVPVTDAVVCTAVARDTRSDGQPTAVTRPYIHPSTINTRRESLGPPSDPILAQVNPYWKRSISNVGPPLLP